MWARRVRNASLALLALVLFASLASPSGAAPVPGSAGTDTSLDSTDSEVTVSGRGPFASLRITVNQTEDLVNQAVSVKWTGGTPTITANQSRFGGHYLQIMQCWGDPDGTVSENPGPPPEQCVQGATDAVFGGRNQSLFPPGGFALERIITRTDFANFDPAVGVVETATRYVWRPFRSVKGKETAAHYDPTFSPAVGGEQYWLNDSFNAVTTNEISGALTRSDGTGEALFEVATGVQSSGLGCGQHVQPNPGGAPKIPKCWLVVVPRGDPGVENEGTPRDATFGVGTSPLSPAAWKNRIAIPLEFNPIESACDISEEARHIAGSELPLVAITSWQPSLCATEGLPPYVYGTIGDISARIQLLSAVTGSPDMVVVSRPLTAEPDPTNPIVYVPLTVSATAIGFNLERVPHVDAPAGEQALRGVRVEELNLTPRLVAKLLTQSYQAQTAIQAPTPYEWAKTNPQHIVQDPDFLRFNPEFELLQTPNAKNLGGLIAPSRTSDVARQVWEWILADPEAKAWLDGKPDEWGMVVDPVYATKADANSTGIAFGDPAPETFPKSDPYCFQAPAQGPNNSIVPQPLCGTDWIPYAQSLFDAARRVRVADDTARTTPDPFALSASGVYKRNGPQILGSRGILGFVDTPSARKFGLQTARLSRAGDDDAERTFIAPDEAGMAKGIASMKPGAEPDVLEPAPTADAPGAYPLTALTYAVLAPLTLDGAARSEYAAFLSYAVQDGQVPGLKVGQLPPGFAPLPPALQAQAKEAVRAILDLEPIEVAETPTESPGLFGEETTTFPDLTPSLPLLGSTSPISRAIAAAALPTLPAETEPREAPAAGALTPILALANNRFVLPILALMALLSALGAVEITRRPGPQPAPEGTA